MKPIRLLNLGAIPAGQTQAVYHALAEQMDESSPDTIVICRPRTPYLCLGYHQVFASVFDPVECLRRGLPIYRRQIGGGATYLDKNQIFYQCIFHQSHMPAMVKDIFPFALAAPVMTIRKLGLQAELRESNEIEVDGRRIAGTGGGQIGEASVVVGNLLFDFDFSAMAAVWYTPTTSFRDFALRAMKESMVTLRGLAVQVSFAKTARLLAESYGLTMGRNLEPGSLSAGEIQAIQRKAKELSAPEHLSLHTTGHTPEPMRRLKISARSSIHYEEMSIRGIAVNATFWVSENHIREAALTSHPKQSWSTQEKSLRGVPYEDWKRRLELS